MLRTRSRITKKTSIDLDSMFAAVGNTHDECRQHCAITFDRDPASILPLRLFLKAVSLYLGPITYLADDRFLARMIIISLVKTMRR